MPPPPAHPLPAQWPVAMLDDEDEDDGLFPLDAGFFTEEDEDAWPAFPVPAAAAAAMPPLLPLPPLARAGAGGAAGAGAGAGAGAPAFALPPPAPVAGVKRRRPSAVDCVAALRRYVEERGFITDSRSFAPRLLLTMRTSMLKADWREVVEFLRAFPSYTPESLSAAVRKALPRHELLDFKDAWRLAGMTPLELVHAAAGVSTRVCAREGIIRRDHAAYVHTTPLTLEDSLLVPLRLLRVWAQYPPTLDRAKLVAAANALLFSSLPLPPLPLPLPPTPAATPTADAIHVSHAHLPLLFRMYPSAARSLSAVNAWVAPTGARFVPVAAYTRAPPLPSLPLTCTSVVAPNALARLTIKYGWSTSQPPAACLRRFAALGANPTFSFPDAVLDAPSNDADCLLTPFAEMAPEEYVCWGTATAQRYLSVADLTGWFREAKALARFEEQDAVYNLPQVDALGHVLEAYGWRLRAAAATLDVEAAATRRRLDAVETLRRTVRTLRDRHLLALAMDETVVGLVRDLDDEGRAALATFFRTLQELAAYCLHWRGPGHPLPRMGDVVHHLLDAEEVERVVYEVAMPPTIDAFHALPPPLRAAIGGLRQLIQPGQRGAYTIQAGLERMQAPDMSAKDCIRLSARPFWLTACTYSELLLNVTLPAYEPRREA